MKKIQKQDEIDTIVKKSVEAFKAVNIFPSFLHSKIMSSVDKNSVTERAKIPWFRVMPRAAAALIVVILVVLSGAKIVEKQNVFVYNKLPVAVALSLQSQANLMNTETELNDALGDSMRGAIFNLEQG